MQNYEHIMLHHALLVYDVILNIIIAFAVIKWYFGFNTGRCLRVTFTFYFISIVILSVPILIMAYGINISKADYLASPLLRLLFPWLISIPAAILTCVSYRQRWRIFSGIRHFRGSAWLAVPVAVQLVLLVIASHEYIFAAQFSPATRNLDLCILVTFLISTVVCMFFLWRIFRAAERDAIAGAHEQLAREAEERINAVRAQRHDFINHIQVMQALLRDGQLQVLARYVEEIRRDLNSMHKNSD